MKVGVEARGSGESVTFCIEPSRLTPSVEQAARYFGGPRYAPHAAARRRIEGGIRQALDLIEPAGALAFHAVAGTTDHGLLHLASGTSLNLPESPFEPATLESLQARSGLGDGSSCRPPAAAGRLENRRELTLQRAGGLAFDGHVPMIAVGIGTLGSGLERCCRSLARQQEIYRSTLLDAVGVAMLDLLGARLCSVVEEQARSRGLFPSRRCSPGLDGYPLERQQVLFQLVGDGTAGVRLNQACIMEPVKSISFFMLLTTVKNDGEPTGKCQACRLDHCQYRSAQ